ncbi:MAG TPA: hypothetical protein VIQ31_00775 [Phormidium sp.]
MSSELDRLLRTFSDAANKSAAASHPADRERWYAFIVAAHKEKPSLEPHSLYQLLIKQGWSEKVASQLVEDQYLIAIGILEYYDSHR